MRENRLSGSEGGATLIPSSLPLSILTPVPPGLGRSFVPKGQQDSARGFNSRYRSKIGPAPTGRSVQFELGAVLQHSTRPDDHGLRKCGQVVSLSSIGW